MQNHLLQPFQAQLQVSLDQLMLAAPVALLAASQTGQILFTNPKLDALFGYTEGELLNAAVEQLVPETLRSLHAMHRKGYVESPQPRTMGSGLDLVGMRKDGSYFPIEVGLSHLMIEDQLIVMASIVDISVRKRTEEMLEERVAERTHELDRRRRISEGLVTVLSMINANRPLDEILNAVLSHATTILGLDACAIIRNLANGQCELQVAKNIPVDYAKRLEGALSDKTVKNVQAQQHIERLIYDRNISQVFDLRSEQSLGIAAFDQCRQILIDAGLRAELSIPLLVRNEVYGSLRLYFKQPHNFLKDEIADAKILGEQIALALENSRLHTDLRLAAVTAERNRIAHDLHDSVTQTLFSASMIADILPTLWQRRPDDAARRLVELRELTRGALAEMRTLLLELRPEALENIELPELLSQLATAFIGRSRIPLTLSVDEACEVEYPVRTALYRIAQEALNNVTKHANASQARLCLNRQGARIEMFVEDDGEGFDANAVRGNHLGLNIMRERAEEIGATLEIESNGENGTKVSVRWMLEK